MSDEAPCHALYRMYDDGGKLLYVGRTINVSGRMKQHRGTKDWWREIITINLEHFDTHEALCEAEQVAIRKESPRYNIAVPLGLCARHRNFRIEDEVWFALARIAELRGERTSEVMRQLAKAYVARHRKLIANDPVWQERLRELRAQQGAEAEAG